MSARLFRCWGPAAACLLTSATAALGPTTALSEGSRLPGPATSEKKPAAAGMSSRPDIRNVGPLDGRYARTTAKLSDYFSKSSLHKYRVRVEIEYFIALFGALPELSGVALTAAQKSALRAVYTDFSVADAETIKATERVTNHDVKAMEYFVKSAIDGIGLSEYREFVHFGLTSQDVNNTAMPLATKEFVEQVYLPTLRDGVLKKMRAMAIEYEDVTMLAKTHGQAATPTRVGKEIMVFVERIEGQLALLEAIPFTGKFGGATGGLNAHKVAYPGVDWVPFADSFYAEAFGMRRQQVLLPSQTASIQYQCLLIYACLCFCVAVHHADRALRQPLCRVRHCQADQHHPHRLQPGHVAVHQHGLFQAGCGGHGDRLLRDAAQGERAPLHQYRQLPVHHYNQTRTKSPQPSSSCLPVPSCAALPGQPDRFRER
jgi:hypothetical protein